MLLSLAGILAEVALFVLLSSRAARGSMGALVVAGLLGVQWALGVAIVAFTALMFFVLQCDERCRPPEDAEGWWDTPGGWEWFVQGGLGLGALVASVLALWWLFRRRGPRASWAMLASVALGAGWYLLMAPLLASW